MKADAKINFENQIVHLQRLNNGRVGITDEANNFCIIDLKSAKKEHNFTFKNSYANIERENISFSNDGRYIAYSEKDQSVVRIIDVNSHKLHHSFPTLNNQIQTLCFDPSSNYLIAGAVTGRVFLWNLFLSGQVSRLGSFPEFTHSFSKPKTNFVSYACFSPSGELVATTGYGGSILVTNIHTEVSPKRITPSHLRINVMRFINEDFLVAGNIEGGINIIGLRSSHLHKHFQTQLESINGLAISKSGRFLLASGYQKEILLIDLKKYKILDSEYICLDSNITRLDITTDNKLLIGCENGELCIYELYPTKELKIILDKSSFYQAFELVQKYPLLKESNLYNQLNEIWSEYLEKAVHLVESGDIDEANNILQKFSKILSKKIIIKDFHYFANNFRRFKISVSNNNFPAAYSMADRISLFKKTKPYKDMEKIWDECFLKAQVFLITKRRSDLLKILAPFSMVSSKHCFIKVLLHKPKIFLEFVQLVQIHNYNKLFKITDKYPCLKEIHSYKDIILETEGLYEKTLSDIYSNDYNSAKKKLDILSNISNMKTQLRELYHIYSLSKRFEILYQKNNLLSCYTLVDKNEELKEMDLVKKLEKEWSKKMKRAEKEALLGDTKEVISILGSLLTLRTRAQKIGTLLRVSFLTQIKLLILKHQYHTVQDAIDNYIKMFSYDTEMHNLITKLKKNKIVDIHITSEQKQRQSRSLWLSTTKGIISDNILESEKYDTN